MLGVIYYDRVVSKLDKGRTDCHDRYMASRKVIRSTSSNAESLPRVTGMASLENRMEKQLRTH